MSLRSRSTIIRFSARFFASGREPRARAASRAGSASRGAVPFIGRVSMPPAPSSAKNSSGERESSAAPGSAHQRAVADRLHRGQRRAGSPPDRPAQRPRSGKRQVRLIDVPRPDVGGDPLEGRAVGRATPGRPERPQRPRPAAPGRPAPGDPAKTPNSSSGTRRAAGRSGGAAARRRSRARRTRSRRSRPLPPAPGRAPRAPPPLPRACAPRRSRPAARSGPAGPPAPDRPR